MRVIAAFFGPYAPDALPSHVSVFFNDFKKFERLTKLVTSSVFTHYNSDKLSETPSLPRSHGSTLQREWCQVNAVSMAIDQQLCHGEATGRGIENPPAAMAGGKIGPGDTGHLAEVWQAVLGHWAITGLHALWSQTRQG